MRTATKTLLEVAKKNHATYNRLNPNYGSGIESESELAIWKMAKEVKAKKAIPIVRYADGIYHLRAYKF